MKTFSAINACYNILFPKSLFIMPMRNTNGKIKGSEEQCIHKYSLSSNSDKGR